MSCGCQGTGLNQEVDRAIKTLFRLSFSSQQYLLFDCLFNVHEWHSERKREHQLYTRMTSVYSMAGFQTVVNLPNCITRLF